MRFFLSLILVASPLMATGISYVTTDASISSGGVFDNYDSVSGLSQSAGTCFLPGGGAGPCATISSTPSTNILGLTSSMVAITNGFGYDPQNGVTGFADASAYANLATGTVGAFATGLACSPNTPLCSDQGEAVAQIQDSLTFTNSTGQTQDIGLSWTFDGSEAATEGDATPSYTMESLFCFGATCGGNQNAVPHGPNSLSLFEFLDSSDLGITNTQPSAGWVSTSITDGSNSTSETFQGVFAVPAGMSTDSLNAFLYLSCAMSSCDFSHTGVFSIAPLPNGVSFTSSSGVLLTGSATPEPASWLLALAGGVLLVLRRRR